MVVRNNIPALTAQRQLSMNNSQVSKNLEKLASGFRINRAADDASGLAISEKMRAQITGLEQAERNAQDGISFIQTAEGAMGEIHDMLNRMTELCVKAANGVYQPEERQNIQDEIDQYKAEINRIDDGTYFSSLPCFGPEQGNQGTTPAPPDVAPPTPPTPPDPGSGSAGGTFKAGDATSNIQLATDVNFTITNARFGVQIVFSVNWMKNTHAVEAKWSGSMLGVAFSGVTNPGSSTIDWSSYNFTQAELDAALEAAKATAPDYAKDLKIELDEPLRLLGGHSSMMYTDVLIADGQSSAVVTTRPEGYSSNITNDPFFVVSDGQGTSYNGDITFKTGATEKVEFNGKLPTFTLLAGKDYTLEMINQLLKDNGGEYTFYETSPFPPITGSELET